MGAFKGIFLFCGGVADCSGLLAPVVLCILFFINLCLSIFYKMSKFIIALDQGTTSSRAVLLNDKGVFLAVKQREFRQIFPQQAWVEQDPKEIYTRIFS